MKESQQKVSIPAYSFILSAVISLVALIVAAVSSSGEGFGMTEFPLLVVLTIVNIILGVAIPVVSRRMGDNLIVTVMAVVMVVFTILCVCLMFLGKMQVFGTVLFSDLEKGYAPAEQACWLGVASIVIYLVATLVAAVGSFFRSTTK